MLSELNQDIVSCEQCPRLIRHCKKIAKEKRKSFLESEYWGRPVPNFGDQKARLLIVGLAPAAHGANRTGRMFTGDRSGDWLYEALHRSGFANQPTSTDIADGLVLKNAIITAVAHCAPPDNKPTPREIQKCQSFLNRTFHEIPFTVVLALGGIAWEACLKELVMMQALVVSKKPKFSHGAEVSLSNNRILLGSYHPSQQNTFTGRLTKKMFDSVFNRAREVIV